MKQHLRSFRRLSFQHHSFNIPSTVGETSVFANMRVDWKETLVAHVFKADLPRLKKEEVKVEVEEGRVLQINRERSKEQEEKNDKWHLMEREQREVPS
ncbi:18.1 kDa class I heat shock protein [Vitis vinifera]|uniref:18.1 kDa class I heat shock protein n=1 Tax=Vitis vinifera TaxID=29760 RepID=A0A438FL50_VITVI|nr:18.1 kDa class I heat shock protein [Vitis vinifera]